MFGDKVTKLVGEIFELSAKISLETEYAVIVNLYGHVNKLDLSISTKRDFNDYLEKSELMLVPYEFQKNDMDAHKTIVENLEHLRDRLTKILNDPSILEEVESIG